MTLQELKEELEQKEQELNNYDETEEYDNMLNESYPELFNMTPSYILKECDEIQYNCGLSDYEDEGRSTLEDEISDLKDEIEELEEDE